MKKNKHKTIYFLLVAVAAFTLNQLAHNSPLITEKLYSSVVYVFLSEVFGRFFSVFPFSFAEFLIVLVIILVIVFVFKTIQHIRKKDVGLKKYFLKALSVILAISCCVYTAFILFCGLNYARPSYGELASLPVKDSSVEELEELTFWLINNTNQSRESIAVDNNGVFVLEQTTGQLSQKSAQIIQEYSTENSLFKGYVPPTKPVVSSYIMSCFNITGIYSPFTFEANINVHQPDYSIPSTMLHELAHFKGFMKESDANFIAFVVGHQSDEANFVYSSNMLALVHTLNAYYTVATNDEYTEMYLRLSEGVKADLRANREYWKEFETPVSELSEKINDGYLKANKQESGTKSYGEMVDLLLAYQKTL